MFHYAPIKLDCNWGSFHLSVLHTAVIVEVDRRNFPYVRGLGWRYNPSARPHGQFLLFPVFARHNNSGWQPIKLDDWPRQFTENRELWTVYLVFDIVCVRLENLDLDLEIRISDFAIESDIRKRFQLRQIRPQDGFQLRNPTGICTSTVRLGNPKKDLEKSSHEWSFSC